jgi:PKD domain
LNAARRRAGALVVALVVALVMGLAFGASPTVGAPAPSPDVVLPTTADLGAGSFPGVGLPVHTPSPEPGPGGAPSAAAIWLHVPLPREAVSASPPGSKSWPAIVNLESWFWGLRLPGTEVGVAVDGYPVSVIAQPVAYAWSFGDGRTVVGPGPGTAAAPVRDTYRRRGDFDVTLFVVWSGRALVSAPGSGANLGEKDLGTVTVPERIVYHAAEVRALLRSRTAAR